MIPYYPRPFALIEAEVHGFVEADFDFPTFEKILPDEFKEMLEQCKLTEKREEFLRRRIEEQKKREAENQKEQFKKKFKFTISKSITSVTPLPIKQ